MDHGGTFRLIAGLGNPGARYAATRHNAGFRVLDELARRAGVSFAFDSRWDADLARDRDRVLMKPRSFMNLSGGPVAGYARFHKFAASQVLVVLDDVALPLGDIRLRKAGGAGGHNGLASVLGEMATDQVPRLRVGIGGASAGDLHDHVLGEFSGDELPILAGAVLRAADAAERASADGLDAAMNLYNNTKS